MSSERIRQLFDLYSANLRGFRPEFAGRFACPLCRGWFTQEQLDQLSIEHVIPQSVGGRIEVLTCKPCNNTYGTRIDAHLGRQLQAQAFFAGEGADALRRRASSQDGKATVDVAIKKSDQGTVSVDVALVRERSNPRQLEKLLTSLNSSNTVIGFDFSGNDKPDIRRARLSLLKSAYLLMFYYFGYGYLITEPAIAVHNQLAQPEEDLLPLKAAVRPLPADHGLQGVGVLTSPRSLACFFIPMQVSHDNYRLDIGVILPGYDQSGELYSRWATVVESEEGANLSVHCFVPDRTALAAPNREVLPISIWNYALDGQGS